MRFTPGQLVFRRYFRLADEMALLTYARVVEDGERGLLLWIADGSPMRALLTEDGQGLRDMSFAEWITMPRRLLPRRWQGPGILVLMSQVEPWSVWWFRDRAGAFLGWYVNLERPMRRWRDGDLAGVDTVDHDLDIVVAPDGAWQWKDEHELVERSGYPEHYWVSDPAAVRTAGERVTKLIEARSFPFDGSWCDFQPDPDWPVPVELPAGWDRQRAG